MALFESLRNTHETLVAQAIQDLAAKGEWQLSPEQAEDVACIALNQLPPRYVREPLVASLYLSAAERQAIEARVRAAVEDAVTQVAQRPARAPDAG